MRRPVPDGFREKARLPKKQLAAEYGVSTYRIDMWRAALDIVFPQGAQAFAIPDTFEADYPKLTLTQLRLKYSVSTETIWRWRDLFGLPMKQRLEIRTIPDDFAEMAAKMGVYGLRMHYRCRIKCIYRWIAESGVTPVPNTQRRNLPDDFATLGARHGNEYLQRHYKASHNIIQRWRKESGVKAPVHTGQAALARMGKPHKTHLVGPDGSLAGRASDYLKRWYVPVAKVEFTDFKGKYPKGHYLVGKLGVMPAEQMIQLAYERDFNPREWTSLAA